jgi:hypothetical protein
MNEDDLHRKVQRVTDKLRDLGLGPMPPTAEQLCEMLDSMQSTCYSEGMWSDGDAAWLDEIKRRVRAAHNTRHD